MTVLTDDMILTLESKGKKITNPFNAKNMLQPASIDLSLGKYRYQYNLKKYTLGDIINDDKVSKTEFEEIQLKTGETAFVGIHEKISIPENTIGFVMPRSSITRLGIQIIPVYMNPGYSGYLPLTIINHSGELLALRPNIRVVQLILFSTDVTPNKVYSDIETSKYSDENVDSSKLHLDQELQDTMNKILQQEMPSLYALSQHK